ncbi:MAG: peptide deformylase [Alphaproteobacteria bacterium]|nr:peptide deformylase [Alphaproteobacteria bacterium]
MTQLNIQIIPAPVLRQVARPILAVDKRIATLMEDMAETMYKGHGIGLAANQVGSLERIITVDVSEERDGKDVFLMANPEVSWHDPEETFTYNEGCLSIPGHYAKVTRPRRIRLTYLNQAGKKQELEAEDLMSQCIQHEIDHLNGVLFIDHISKLKRDIILKKIDKERKEEDGHVL